jgi:hypothetical protein
LLVGSVSFFGRTNGMSRYAGIFGVLWVTLRACTYCEVLLETSVSLVCQQVPGVCLNPTDHYRIHKSPAHIHILSLLNSFHTLLFMIHFNIIIQSTPVFQAVFSQPQFCMHLHACNMPTLFLDLITRAVYEQTSQLPIASFLFLSCPVTLRNNLQATDRPTAATYVSSTCGHTINTIGLVLGASFSRSPHLQADCRLIFVRLQCRIGVVTHLATGIVRRLIDF